ncbi:MAG: ribulose-phosphate 3-epimerase [Candidatus Hydrogenedentes bacterium]|nr:ribulose-phosphate 3-epimerase [Candidatus Hydrogenedentota bacterium]
MDEFRCCPSVMCADPLHLHRDLQALQEAGADEFHFDIMDGSFVPNITLGVDVLKAVKQRFGLHCNAHLMIERPDRYVDRFIQAGADSVTVHVEACLHANRVLNQIRDLGASPGIALNPATPLTRLEYLLPLVDRVCIMTVNPGYAGQKLIPSAFERVRILRENIKYHGYRAKIEVDGNISAENAGRLAAVGAEIFVLGTASIFMTDDRTFAERLRDFKKQASIVRATA